MLGGRASLARGSCLWVRSARNPNPLAVTTPLPPIPIRTLTLCGGDGFFLMGGKTETRPPESHVFDSQKTPIFTMLGLGSPLPWGPTLASVPRDSPSKKLTAPHGVDRLFFCLTERGNSHRPKGWTVAGLKEGRGSVPPYGSQAALLHWGTYPPSKQAGRLTRARLHGSRDPRQPPTGSRVGGTDRPPHQKVSKVLPSIAADWAAAVDTSGVLRVGWAPRPSRSATGTSEAETLCRACAEHSGSGGPLGPIFYGRAWVPTPQADGMSMGVHGICCSHVPPEVII